MKSALLFVSLSAIFFVGGIHCIPICGTDPIKNFTVTETTIIGSVQTVSWLGQDLFLLTDKQIAYHSKDGGQTWENVLPAIGVTTGGIRGIYANADYSAVYLLGEISSSSQQSNVWVYAVSSGTYKQQSFPAIMDETTLKPHFSDPQLVVVANKNYPYQLYGSDNQFVAYTKLDEMSAYGYWGYNRTYFYVTFDSLDQYLKVIRDWGSSPEFITDRIRGLLAVSNVMFIAKQLDDGGLQLLTSTNLGSGPWIRAMFPTELQEHFYNIIDVSVGSIIIGVMHNDQSRSNVYMSDTTDSRFVLAIPNVVRMSTNHLQFRLLGVEGMILANQYIDATNITTVLTSDNGGTWNTLVPPTKCTTPSCSLQLHMNSKRDKMSWGPIHTRLSAIGLILGTGNVGPVLDNGPANQSTTFFSRTAGITWQYAASGSRIYEFADHGGLMVLVDNVNPTNILSYSWNEAMSVIDCQFTQDLVSVTDVIVEPTAISQSFLLYGKRANQSIALLYLDFSTLHERQCNSSDYEDWPVLGDKCLLGQRTVYTRRKQDSECYNPLAFEPEAKTQICSCTRDDYECDYCFEEDGTSCDFVCGDEPENTTCIGNTHMLTKGFRLVPGTVCNVSTGLNLLPAEVPCKTDHVANDDSSNAVSAVVSILLIIAVVLGGVYLWRNERTRRWLEDRFAWGRYKLLGDNRSDQSLLAPDNDSDHEDHTTTVYNFSESSSPVK